MRTQGNMWTNFLRLVRGLLKGKQICFIGKDVRLGVEVKLSPMVFIDDNVTIGDGTFLGYGCVIRPSTVIGKECTLGHFCVIEGCKIGNRVGIHVHCTLAIGTIVEDDVFMAPYCWAGNVKNIDHGRGLNPPIEAPVLRRAARIGGQVGIFPGVEVGENAVIGIGSLVTKNVPPREVWFGRPAEKRGSVSEREIL